MHFVGSVSPVSQALLDPKSQASPVGTPIFCLASWAPQAETSVNPEEKKTPHTPHQEGQSLTLQWPLRTRAPMVNWAQIKNQNLAAISA